MSIGSDINVCGLANVLLSCIPFLAKSQFCKFKWKLGFWGVACIWLGNLLLRPLKVFNPQSLVLDSRRHQAFSRLRLSLRLRCSFVLYILRIKTQSQSLSHFLVKVIHGAANSFVPLQDLQFSAHQIVRVSVLKVCLDLICKSLAVLCIRLLKPSTIK